MGERTQNVPPVGGDAVAAAATPPRLNGRPDLDDEAAVENDEDFDLDIETALLALSEDMSGPTVDVDVSGLSPAERRAVLHCLRERLGLGLPPQKPG